MSDVNWCLMAVSFGLGLLLTLAFLIRRVKREVPVYGSGGGAAGLTGSAGVKAPKLSAPDVDVDADADLPTAKVPKVDLPDVDVPDASAAGAGGLAAAKLAGSGGDSDEPYGAGSARVAAGAAAPSGWTIKGNEDSMLYHSPESPSYKQTIAELWFRDEETAIAAGFARWDSGKSQRGQR